MNVPNEDKSAATLAAMLRAKMPFYFIKLGDAACELIYHGVRREVGMKGAGTQTCDGEKYTDDLAKALLASWMKLGAADVNLFVGDWQTASFTSADDKSRYANEYTHLMSCAPTAVRLHFECLLLMRETPELLDFYEAVRSDKRRKLLMGPIAWRPLADLLSCEFIGLPVMPNLFDIVPQIGAELKSMNFDVLLYGAGTAGHIAVIDCWQEHPTRTYINLGSALDPACSRGRTRKQQIAPNRAKAFLEQLVPLACDVVPGWGNKFDEANTRARQQDGGRCTNGHARGQRGCSLCEDLL